MREWIENVMTGMGYPGVTLLMFLENVFPPIPSELVMPLAGFVAGRGELNFWGVVLSGTLGSVLGALPIYYVGALLGPDRARRLADEKLRWLGFSGKDFDKAQAWFDRKGTAAVFLGRMVPGVRSLISVPAGVHRMPIGPFLIYTTAGAAIWTAGLAYAGKLLGRNYERVEGYIGPIGYAVLALIVLGLIVFAVRRRREARSGPATGA